MVFWSITCAASSTVQVPDWVRQLASSPVGSYPPRTDAVFLRDESTVHFTSANEYVETSHKAWRILRPEGRELGLLSVGLFGKEKVQNVHGWSITADGKQFEVKEKDFVDHSLFNFELYSDGHSLSAKVSGADVGSVVALEYTVVRHLYAPIFDWTVQSVYPVRESNLTIELPADWEFKVAWANMQVQSPVNLGGNRWQWVIRDIGAIDTEEEMRPSARALESRFSIAFGAPGMKDRLDTWNGIGRFSYQLSSDRHTPTAEIEAKVRELTAGKSGFDAVASTLAAFVQSDIRYVAIELGIGGWQPHYAADIFKHRYGDCKDKSTLLAAMLQAANISSVFVNVHTSHGAVREDLPTFFAFNHEVLAIELPEKTPEYRAVVTTKSGKRYLIFDPTWRYTPFGELSAELQGSFALLETEIGGELVKLPVLVPEHSQLERTAKFQLGSDGALSGDVEERRSGSEAYDLRDRMLSSTDLDRTRYLEHMVGRHQKGFVLKQSKLENLEEISKELVVHYSITADHYAQNSGPLLLIRPRVLGQKSFALQWSKRKYPVDLFDSTRQTDSVDIQLPEGYVVDDLPDPVKIDVGFASYSSKYESNGNVLRYSREYVVRDPYVPLEKMTDLKRFEERIAQDEFASAVLKKK
jgi:hypothetical protein